MRRLRLDRHALLLGADQLDQGILVAVLELLRLELARHLGDYVLCELEHLPGQIDIRDLGEIPIRRMHLVGEMQAGRHDPLAARLELQHALAPEQDGAGEPDHLFGAHGLADHREGLLADAVRGREVIGRIEIESVDLGAGHEPLDVDGVVAVHLHGLELVVLEHDVLALGDLVALRLALGLDRLAGLLVDELAPHAISRLAIEGAKGNPLRGRRGRIEGDRARDERKLEITLPVGSWRHVGAPIRWDYAAGADYLKNPPTSCI